MKPGCETTSLPTSKNEAAHDAFSSLAERGIRPPDLPNPAWRVALFLDVDGTLAPITSRPELTRIPVETRRILAALQARGVAMAALSGRPLSQVRRLLLPVNIPMAGSHGAQFSLAPGRGIREVVQLPDGLVSRLQQAVDGMPGVWLERKPGAFAVHWRQSPQHRFLIDEVVRQALVLAPDWHLVEGHSVHELRRRGRDKGVMLRRLMRLPGFSGRWPLAIGDDRTDEDAFKAALALGGGAIRVGQGADTLAPWSVKDVKVLAQWLKAQLEVMRT